MFDLDRDMLLTVNVITILIEGVWYILEIAVMPNGMVYSIVQIGKGVRA